MRREIFTSEVLVLLMLAVVILAMLAVPLVIYFQPVSALRSKVGCSKGFTDHADVAQCLRNRLRKPISSSNPATGWFVTNLGHLSVANEGRMLGVTL